MAKKRIKMPVFLVACDDLVMTTEDDEEFHPREGEWVKFYKRLPGRMVKLMLRAMRLQGIVGEDEEAAGELEDTLDKLVPMLAKTIHSWNWSDLWADVGDDEDVVLLPSPPTADAIWDLNIDTEIFYLIGKLMTQTQSPKAPD